MMMMIMKGCFGTLCAASGLQSHPMFRQDGIMEMPIRAQAG